MQQTNGLDSQKTFALGRAYYRLRAEICRYLAQGKGDTRTRLQLEKELKHARKLYADAGGILKPSEGDDSKIFES